MRRPKPSADKLHAVAKFNVVTGEQAKAPPGPPTYTKCLRRGADRRGRAPTRGSSPSPRRCRPAPGSTSSRKQFPDRMLRRRHRRAARGHLRRRHGDRGHEAVLRDLFHLPAARPTTRSCMTWRSRSCRCASPWTAPVWSAPTARPMPAASTLPISAACPNIVLMAPSDEAELMHMVATAAAIDDRPIARSAIRAARAWAWRCRSAARRWAIGKGRILREGGKVAILSLGPAAGRLPAAPPTSWRRAASRPRSPMPASRSRWTPTLIDQLARHHEVLITIEEGAAGGFGAAVVHHLAWIAGLLDRGLEIPADDAAGPAHRPQHAGRRS